MTKSIKKWYLDHERAILLTSVAAMTAAAWYAQARVEAHRQFLRDAVKLYPAE